MVVDYLDEFRVDPFRKQRIIFKIRPDLLQIQGLHIITEYHTMRIPHRNTGDAVLPSADHRRGVDDGFLFAFYRDGNSVQLRLPHIHRAAFTSPPVLISLMERMPLSVSTVNSSLRTILLSTGISPYSAARAAAASLTAVAVEHPHFGVRYLGSLDEHQPLATNPVMPVGNAHT